MIDRVGKNNHTDSHGSGQLEIMMSLKINQVAKTHNGTPIRRVRFDSVEVGDSLVHIPSGEMGVVESLAGRRGTVDATIVFAAGKRITRRTWASKSLWKVVSE